MPTLRKMNTQNELNEGPDGFKLNNNVTSRLARWAMAEYPDLQGFFEVRELKSG